MESDNTMDIISFYSNSKTEYNEKPNNLENNEKPKEEKATKIEHGDDKLPDMSQSITNLKPLLKKLSPDELKLCSEREKKGKDRKGIYNYIHKILNPKSRKSCETPPEELIVPLYLLFGPLDEAILCDETLLRSKIQEAIDDGILICKDNLNGYISNVIEQGEKSKEYLKLCQKMDHLRQDIEQVIIAGKKQCDLTPELDDIHKLVENKAKTIKSDVYIKYTNNKIKGLSIKKNKYCQDTNFSVMSFFDNKAKEIFITAKTKMMKSIEITPFTYVKDEHRDAVNELLLNRNNDLWEFFRSKIAESPYIGKEILQSIYGTKLPYPIIKFSGSEMRTYSKEDIEESSIKFEECEQFYNQIKNGKTRNTAKMFYLLEYKGDKYRVEIRFKGNHGKRTSPQFLAYSLK